MTNNESKAATNKPKGPEGAQTYKRPELKKHGKLKNKASAVSTYTYTYIT